MFSRQIQRSRSAGFAALLAAFMAAVLVVGCGGGGDSAGTTAVATSYSEGPIEGLGSIIVGGVRYDDSTAVVEDEDGNAQARSELKLGVTVEVEASDVRNALARALHIRFGADIVGPVDSVDVAASTMVVLGQTVEVKEHTIFSDDLPSGLAGIQIDSVLAVHALYDAQSGHYIATRLDARPNAPVYRLRGLVSGLDTNAKTFRIGSEVISYAKVAAQDLPQNLSDGLRVRVRLETTQVNGQWVALSVRHGVRRFDHPLGFVHLHGIVSSFTSTTQFAVNGIAVDASGASFPDGTAGLVLGARVHIDGRIENGTIIARRVALHDHPNHAFRFELHGQVANLDSSAKTFELREQTVHYGTTVAYVNGTSADLANGRKVEVKGLLSVDRRKLFAVVIKFEE